MRYFLLTVGLGMIGFGLKLAYQRIAFLFRSQKAYGKPVNWKEVPQINSRKIYYYPEVVFETPDGTEHRVTSDIGYDSVSSNVIVDRDRAFRRKTECVSGNSGSCGSPGLPT